MSGCSGATSSAGYWTYAVQIAMAPPVPPTGENGCGEFARRKRSSSTADRSFAEAGFGVLDEVLPTPEQPLRMEAVGSPASRGIPRELFVVICCAET